MLRAIRLVSSHLPTSPHALSSASIARRYLALGRYCLKSSTSRPSPTSLMTPWRLFVGLMLPLVLSISWSHNPTSPSLRASWHKLLADWVGAPTTRLTLSSKNQNILLQVSHPDKVILHRAEHRLAVHRQYTTHENHLTRPLESPTKREHLPD